MPEAQTVLAQILRMVPRTEFEKLARQHGGENRVRSFPCWSQFACLVYAQLSRQTSLRDLVLALETKKPLLYHCLGTTEVRHSTLADANERQPEHYPLDEPRRHGLPPVRSHSSATKVGSSVISELPSSLA